MKDEKFASEYREAVQKITLPENYKENILSNLDFTQDLPERRKKKAFVSTLSAVAAVLVITISLTLFFTIYKKTPVTREIRMNVASATNLKSVAGATIVFKDKEGEPLRDENGEVITAVADENGLAVARVPHTDNVSAEISMDGYITSNVTPKDGNYYISPEMNEDTYRAVLVWENDCDLDAILTVTDDKGVEKLHYFNSDIVNDRGEVIATLDTDSETPLAPETITFNATDNGVFRFSVGSYSSLKTGGENKLSGSLAQVTLYKGDKIIGKYNVDTTAQGNVWCVFELENSRLNVCDYTYSVSAITDIN